MSIFRRRNNEGTSSSAPTTTKDENGEEVCLVPVSQLKAVGNNARKRRTGLIFALGGLFGIVLAAFFADKNDVIRFSGLAELADLHLEGLSNVLPAGMVREAKDRSVRLYKAPGWF